MFSTLDRWHENSTSDGLGVSHAWGSLGRIIVDDVDLILLQDLAGIVVDEQDLCLPCLAGLYMQAPSISGVHLWVYRFLRPDSSFGSARLGRRQPLGPDRSRTDWLSPARCRGWYAQ